MSSPMTLDVWAGDWGLASVDRDCLRALAYIKFCGAPIQVRTVRTPFFSPTGKLPVFKHGSTVLTKFEDIVDHLSKKNFYADIHLSEVQKYEASSYACYLEEKLLPALLHMWWINEKNYLEFTRPWYADNLRLPFNFYYPAQFLKDAKSRIEACYNGTPDEIETQVYNEAEQCLNNLSKKLGDNDFFNGKSPCSLDATVFAYLGPLFRVPFPSNRLQNHLKASPALIQFLKRVDQNIFSSSFIAYENQKKAEAVKKETEEDFPNQRRNWLYAGLFATLAMAGYLMSQGMLQISLQPQKSSNKKDLDDAYGDIYIHES